MAPHIFLQFLKFFAIIIIENETENKNKGEMLMKIMFIVRYTDDFHKQHITFVTSMAEVNYIKERFSKVTFEVAGSR